MTHTPPTPEQIAAMADRLARGEPIGEVRPDATEVDTDAQLTSWSPIDLGPILAGTYAPPTPTLLHFHDAPTSGLFYRGRVNGLHGDPGCGKTWLALHAIAQVLDAGRVAMLIDFEATPAEVVARLVALGVTPDAIRERFRYVRPDLPAGPLAMLTLRDQIETDAIELVVLDSVGEALGLWGYNENADAEVAPWLNMVPRALADAGATVVLIDHGTKANDNPLYPSGSKRKLAFIGGAQYLVKAVKAPSREDEGRLTLTCAKDRHGTYRKGHRAADVTVTPTVDDGVRIVLYPVTEADEGPADLRLRMVAAEAVKWVRDQHRPCSRNEIEQAKPGQAGRELIRGALDYATGVGALREEPGPRNARMAVYVHDLKVTE